MPSKVSLVFDGITAIFCTYELNRHRSTFKVLSDSLLGLKSLKGNSTCYLLTYKHRFNH